MKAGILSRWFKATLRASQSFLGWYLQWHLCLPKTFLCLRGPDAWFCQYFSALYLLPVRPGCYCQDNLSKAEIWLGHSSLCKYSLLSCRQILSIPFQAFHKQSTKSLKRMHLLAWFCPPRTWWHLPSLSQVSTPHFTVSENGVWQLTAQKTVKRQDWWKGKFALFWMPATGREDGEGRLLSKSIPLLPTDNQGARLLQTEIGGYMQKQHSQLLKLVIVVWPASSWLF